MRVLCVLAAACSAPSRPPPETAVVSSTSEPDAGVEATPSPDARTSAARRIPDSLRKLSPQLVARRLKDGMVPPAKNDPDGLFTYELRREGNDALITVEHREGRDDGTWNVESTTQHVGTITDTAKGFHFVASDLELTCERETVDVAAPTAKRMRSPGAQGGDCGDPGVWRPSSTKRVAVLRCRPDATESHQIAFAAPPGVEWVFVDNDCVFQGGGWRLVASDGRVNPTADRP